MHVLAGHDCIVLKLEVYAGCPDSACMCQQVIAGLGTSEQELEVDIQERLADAEHMHTADEALNGALLVSARAVIAQLRASAAASAPDEVSFPVMWQEDVVKVPYRLVLLHGLLVRVVVGLISF